MLCVFGNTEIMDSSASENDEKLCIPRPKLMRTSRWQEPGVAANPPGSPFPASETLIITDSPRRKRKQKHRNQRKQKTTEKETSIKEEEEEELTVFVFFSAIFCVLLSSSK